MKKNSASPTCILNLENYLPYRVSILSNKISGKIADTYRKQYSLSITEWRIMAILGEFPGISADQVSLKTQTEKSILSRAITKLLDKKLLYREFSTADRRRSILTLTAEGISVYNEIVPKAAEFEQKMLECFSEDEWRNFSEMLDRLYRFTDGL